MKASDFSHWNLSESTQGLLFFAQSMEEMLFFHGHDSLKVPALNFRFLCLEIQKTLEKIDNEIVDKSNMRFLFDELQDTFNRDPIAKELYGNDFNCLFFAKNATGDIHRNCSDLYKDPCTEASMKQIRRTIDYLLDDMDMDDKYFSVLQSKIMQAVKTLPFDFTVQDELYQLTRALLTDLINFSYSQEYIYLVVKDIFYNRHNLVLDIDSSLDLFWSYFDFKEKEYTVILPLKIASLQKQLKKYTNFSIEENTDKLFGNSCKWIIETTIEAKDPHAAQLDATALVNFFVSLLQYSNHKSKSYKAEQAIVIPKDSNKIYPLQAPITPLKRGRTPSVDENNKKISLMVQNFPSFRKLTNVIELHSSAMNSIDIGNQLLNLWTIIEVLVPTEPKNTFSKINQICNVVTSVLNAQYIASLISQLLADLYHCIPGDIDATLATIQEGKNNLEKMVAILVLPQHQSTQNQIINNLNTYPLLQYRIAYYSSICSDRSRINHFLTAHRKRLSWQIVRIYRNRNMIVHDGSHFPYIDILVQNLHYYADILIDTVNLYANRGYDSLSTIYTALQQREYRHTISLEEKERDGSPKKVDSDFLHAVLGYLI